MSKILSSAMALAIALSPMAASASASVAQLQAVTAQDSLRISALALAFDNAEVRAGKAVVTLPKSLAYAIAFDVATYQGFKAFNTGNDVVERAAQLSNKLDVTAGDFLGSRFQPVNPALRFVGRNATRVAGYSMAAYVGVLGVFYSADALVNTVRLTYDVAALAGIKARIEYAHHRLGEATEALAEAQK